MNVITDFFTNLYTSVAKLLNKVANISNGTDVFGTIESIKKDIHVRGSNVWILVCSTMLASIGLDLNSTAVIIGAMLISPLMSPILGIGLSVGINDRETLINSLKNFGIAIAVSLLTSAFYFLLSPLGEITPEITARTQPTLLDVFVALFGGVAGIVAGSRKEKTNAIPGVAIATALMPPLCVAGFGLATGHWDCFVGAFYLFFINAVFIATATYLIVRFLRFPYKEFMDMEQKKRVKRWMSLFAVLIMAPSFYFLFSIISEVRLKKQVNKFVTEYVNPEHVKVMDWQLVKTDSLSYIEMTLHGRHLPKQTINKLNADFKNSDIDYDLELSQLSDLSFNEINKRTLELRNDFNSALDAKQTAILEQTIENQLLQNQLDSIVADTVPFVDIKTELHIVFPDLKSFAYSKDMQFTARKSIPTAVISWQPKMRSKYKTEKELRLQQFLINRLDLDTLQIVNH